MTLAKTERAQPNSGTEAAIAPKRFNAERLVIIATPP